MPPRAKSKPAPTAAGPAPRKVLYPNVELINASGKAAITPDQAKALLGWTEDPDQARALGCQYPLVEDRLGNKIYMVNNVTNRPIYSQLYDAYAQELLNKRWSGPNGNGKTVNGENIIIGKTGLVLNGQHSLIAIVLAEQERVSEKAKHHWAELWKGPVVMDKTIARGVDEDDDVVNTMDTCKPRGFSDVVYRSDFFKDVSPPLTPSSLDKLSKLVESAVEFVWKRAGYGTSDVNPWSRHRTNTVGVDFLRRHPRLLEAVRFIHTENQASALKQYRPGTASALLYLMGTCATDGDAYRSSNPPSEDAMDFSAWDAAKEYWAALARGAKSVLGVRQGLAWLLSPNDDDKANRFNSPKPDEKISVLVKGWEKFRHTGKVVVEDVKLKFKTEDEGNGLYTYILDETVSCGGIDLAATKSRPEPAPAAAPAAKAAKSGAPGKGGAAAGGSPQGLQEELADLQAKHPDRLLMFKGNNSVNVHGADAKKVAKLLGLKSARSNDTGMERLSFPVDVLEQHLTALVGGGAAVAVISFKDGNKVAEYYPIPERVDGHTAGDKSGRTAGAPKDNGKPKAKPKPKPKPKPKAVA